MRKKTEPDVVVIGGGVLGLCSAYHCAQAGLKVTLVDQGKVAGRASGGIVGAMAPYTPDNWYSKKQFQFEALSQAEQFWAEVDALSGLSSGYGRIGRLVPIETERALELAQERVQGAKNHWAGRFEWNVLQNHLAINEKYTPFGVIHDTLSARLFPKHACASLHRAVLKLGVKVIEDWPAETLSENVVYGTIGELRSDRIIIAAGFDGFELMKGLTGLDCGTGVKGQAALLQGSLPDIPQIYADGIYIVSHTAGGIAVGSTSENEWTDPVSTDEKLDAVIAKARALLPSLGDAPVTSRWADIRPKAKRRDIMLGPVPNAPNVIAAMGGFKIGFGLAHKAGAAVADITMGKQVDLPPNFLVTHHLQPRPL